MRACHPPKWISWSDNYFGNCKEWYLFCSFVDLLITNVNKSTVTPRVSSFWEENHGRNDKTTRITVIFNLRGLWFITNILIHEYPVFMSDSSPHWTMERQAFSQLHVKSYYKHKTIFHKVCSVWEKSTVKLPALVYTNYMYSYPWLNTRLQCLHC